MIGFKAASLTGLLAAVYIQQRMGWWLNLAFTTSPNKRASRVREGAWLASDIISHMFIRRQSRRSR